MAADRGQPGAAVAGGEGETADHPLAALVVAVEQLHGELAVDLNGLAHLGIARLGRVAERPLPEADVARRHAQVAGQGAEALGRRAARRRGPARPPGASRAGRLPLPTFRSDTAR